MSTQPASTTRTRYVFAGPGEGRPVPGPEGITLKATAEQTAGSIGVFEATSPAGFEAPAHIHHTSDELFYVLSGTFEFRVGDDLVTAPAGSFLFVPRGTIHAPRVVGTEPGKGVMAFVPGGQERAFEEFAALAAATGEMDLNSPEAQAIARRHGSQFVEVSATNADPDGG